MERESASEERPIRVLVAKAGLDGHDLGAKLVCRALMEAGMEVIYTGLRRSPEEIARTALEEGVDVVGLSILSGAHLPICRKLARELHARGLEDLFWVVGGNIPRRDRAALLALGVRAVLPTGTPFEEIVEAIRRGVRSSGPSEGASENAAARSDPAGAREEGL